MSKKFISFYERYVKIRIFEIALMGLLLGVLSILKYLSFILFKGPLNFSIDILFWIIIGVLFGPIKGVLFSILCDTVFTIFTTGVIYWMIEYAMVAPLISLASWFLFSLFKEEKKWTIYFALTIITIAIIISIIFFFFQLKNNLWKYEGWKGITSTTAYLLIICLNFFVLIYVCFCLFKYLKGIKKQKNEENGLSDPWRYIWLLYVFSIFLFIVIIFRWLWGPFAYIAYMNKFYSKNYDWALQYPITLSGIVMKSCVSIPLGAIILTPTLFIVKSINNNKNWKNAF